MERALSWRDLAILGVTGGPIFAALTFGLSPPKALAAHSGESGQLNRRKPGRRSDRRRSPVPMMATIWRALRWRLIGFRIFGPRQAVEWSSR
jgi:hypothetical protein